MPTKEELERRNLTDLAVLCGEVADNPSADADTAEKAWQLKREWLVVTERETPPPPSLKENQQIEAEKEALRKRMVEFLAGVQ